MNQKVVATIGLFAIFIAGIGSYFIVGQQRQSPEQAEMPRIETPADVNQVEFSLPDLTGTMRDQSEWQGKAQLINFWATWCAPCRREIPLLKKVQEEHAADNVQVIGIAVDFEDAVVAYAEETQFNYPILIGQEDAMAVAETSGVDFIGMPFTMVVAPSGQLIKAHIGEIMESHIEEILDVIADLERGSIDVDGAREALGTL
jgi:thiol-disulfide isomerase/thioredoxin